MKLVRKEHHLTAPRGPRCYAGSKDNQRLHISPGAEGDHDDLHARARVTESV